MHTPWDNAYPKKHTRFVPILGNKDLSSKNKENALNSYANAICYSVDGFFKALFEQTDLLSREDSIIIYTSDHGQHILEKPHVAQTHCNTKDVAMSEGVVPFIIFAKNNDLFSSVKKNQYSHFQIFPTIVRLMGYQSYHKGFSILDQNNAADSQEFLTGDLFGRGKNQKISIKKYINEHLNKR